MSEALKSNVVLEVGVTSEKGHRRTMEDCHVEIPSGFLGSENCAYFAVFDGHGGKSAAEWCSKNLHTFISQKAQNSPSNLSQQTFQEAFREADAALLAAGVEFAGCTATVCIIHKDDKTNERTLHVSNVGDTHAVLCSSLDQPPIKLTAEHRTNDESEVSRIKTKGGFVVDNRVNGMLAVTRTLGDHAMKEFISNEPSYTCTKLNSANGQVLIIACDGLWDHVKIEDAAKDVLTITETKPAARALFGRALGGGSSDNVTIMVIKL